jgi:hypothetical protein
VIPYDILLVRTPWWSLGRASRSTAFQTSSLTRRPSVAQLKKTRISIVFYNTLTSDVSTLTGSWIVYNNVTFSVFVICLLSVKSGVMSLSCEWLCEGGMWRRTYQTLIFCESSVALAAHETAICRTQPIHNFTADRNKLGRSRNRRMLEHVMFLRKYKEIFFCAHKTLTEGVLVTQLSRNAGI